MTGLKEQLSQRWQASGNQAQQGDLHLNVAREIEVFLRGMREKKKDGKPESLSDVASRILLALAAEVIEEASQGSKDGGMHIPQKAAG